MFKIGATPAHADLPKPEIQQISKSARREAGKKAATQAEVSDAPSPSAPLTQEAQAYCVKCKAMRPLTEGKAIFMANGRPAAVGLCGVCGTKLFKIGATADHAGLEKPTIQQISKSAKRTTDAKANQRTSESAKKGSTKTAKPSDTGQRTKAAPAKSAVRNPQSLSGKLVIVESPAKARTVGRFLGKNYEVRASVGHVRDLLKSKLSVDLEHDFAPTYRVPDEKKEIVKSLHQAAAGARQVYLATDPDREGEAIAWHLLEAAQIPVERVQRVVFHEITKHAIDEAFANARDIDMRLVDAQQARRILDRLVGYQVSPLLWDRVKSRLSAGRVQTVAQRLIVEREREINAFVAVEYWSIDADLAQQTTRSQSSRPSFMARLIRIRGQEADLKNRDDTLAIVSDLERSTYPRRIREAGRTSATTQPALHHQHAPAGCRAAARHDGAAHHAHGAGSL